MAAVLIQIVRRPRLGKIIRVHFLRRTENGRARVNEQMNVALQMNRAAQISSGRNEHRAAPNGDGSGNGFINCRTVEVRAVADCAEVADVENILTGHFGGVQADVE